VLHASAPWVAGVDRARIAVVDDRGSTGLTNPRRAASLDPVASVSIGAAGTGRKGRVPRPELGVTGVSRTGVAVIDDGCRARHAGSRGVAGFMAVAQRRVVAPRTGREHGMRYTRRGIARIGRAGVAVIDQRRHARLARTRCVAGLAAVTEGGVVASRTGGGWRVGDGSVCWIARVDRARVAIVDIDCRARAARAGLTLLGAVAGIAIGAACSVGGRGVDNGACLAAVDGAGISVVGIQRSTSRANALRGAGLLAIARVTVAAAGAAGPRSVVNASGGIASVVGARVGIGELRWWAALALAGGCAGFEPIARVTVRAVGPHCFGGMGYAQHRVASIGGAGVIVVDDRQRASPASAVCVAGFDPVTNVTVAARAAGRGGQVADARGGITAVDRARVAVIDHGRNAGCTGATSAANLCAVAGVSVRAGATRGQRSMSHSGLRRAGICRARVAVIDRDRGPRLTEPRAADARRVTSIGGRARRAVRQRSVAYAERSVARICRTRVAVVQHRRGAALALTGAIADLPAVA